MVLLSSAVFIAALQVTLIYRCEHPDGSLTLSGTPCAEANADNMSMIAVDELPDNVIPSPNAAKPTPVVETAVSAPVVSTIPPAANMVQTNTAAPRLGYSDHIELKNLQTVRRSRSLSATEQAFLSAEMQRIANGQFAQLSSLQRIARDNALNSLGMGRESTEIYNMIDTVENIYRMQGQTVEPAQDIAARRTPTIIYSQPYSTYPHYHSERPTVQINGRYQSDKVRVDINLSD